MSRTTADPTTNEGEEDFSIYLITIVAGTLLREPEQGSLKEERAGARDGLREQGKSSGLPFKVTDSYFC